MIIWRTPSYGIWRHVDLVWTDVSEERIAFIFRVEKYASEELAWAGGCRLSHQSETPSWWLSLQPPAHAGSSFADFSTLKMEAIRSSETSVHTRSTRSHIPEDGIFRSHRRENLKSYIEDYFILAIQSYLTVVAEHPLRENDSTRICLKKLF
jgi:hypothetical protein